MYFSQRYAIKVVEQSHFPRNWDLRLVEIQFNALYWHVRSCFSMSHGNHCTHILPSYIIFMLYVELKIHIIISVGFHLIQNKQKIIIQTNVWLETSNGLSHKKRLAIVAKEQISSRQVLVLIAFITCPKQALNSPNQKLKSKLAFHIWTKYMEPFWKLGAVSSRPLSFLACHTVSTYSLVFTASQRSTINGESWQVEMWNKEHNGAW